MSFSVVIPVYRNSENIEALLAALDDLSQRMDHQMDAVFVVDGSPDDSYDRLRQALGSRSFPSQLLSLSRNYGSFSAIRAGLAAAPGEAMGVMAADLQEPPELMLQFRQKLLEEGYDVAVGVRESRRDPLFTNLSSRLFWKLYRRYVSREMPVGGVDIFACTPRVRDELLRLPENRTSLVAQLYWIGFRRAEVKYGRLARTHGVSGWTLAKKVNYLLDSVFAFSELPVRLLTRVGLLGLVISAVWGAVVLYARLTHHIPIPGYTATMLVISFFGALNCFGLGVIGEYVWRAFENTKGRPNYIVASREEFAENKTGKGAELS
jgi:glycosyltransferase involved in cell wall biosynthesis